MKRFVEETIDERLTRMPGSFELAEEPDDDLTRMKSAPWQNTTDGYLHLAQNSPWNYCVRIENGNDQA